MRTKTPEQGIASDQLDSLQEHPERCGWLSVHAGRHPYVRYATDVQRYLIAEISGVGRVEIEAVEKNTLINLFAENPVDVIPVNKATFSSPRPGSRNVWEFAAEGGEHVRYANELAAEAEPL